MNEPDEDQEELESNRLIEIGGWVGRIGRHNGLRVLGR